MKTPVSSRYPVLDNKPIDQWKVTELKEELKRRKLMTKGLKDDLIRRLDEALRAEMETVAATDPHDDNNDVNGAQEHKAETVVLDAHDTATEHPVVAEEVNAGERVVVNADESVVGNADESVVGNANENVVGVDEENVDDAGVNAQVSGKLLGEGKSEEQHCGLVSDPAVPGVGVETVIDVPAACLISDPAAHGIGVVSETDVPSALGDDDVSEGFPVRNAVGRDGLLVDITEEENGDSTAQQHSEDIKPPNEDVKLDSSVPKSQVSEVSSSLGFPVKSNNSVSTDSVSIIEKNDLKDNIIADNVKLESDLKPEMVHPSSSDLVTDGGESHPGDVEEPHEYKVYVEETDITLANADLSQKNYSADLGSSEKLNLDRSSGDDSMEEDALESKQIESNYNSEEVGEKTEQSEVTANKRESPVETMDTDSPVEKKGVADEKSNAMATLSDKRKLSYQEAAAVDSKPAKRQHRWKTESNDVSVPQFSNISSPAPAKDVPQFAAPKRNFSRSDSIGANDPAKEREVPPSSKAATDSLRIDNFLRPFTLKAVQELLGRTGTVTSFWMDHIKTHCYVTYSSVEEAVETRNAVYNLQWPPNGGRQLVADFVDAEDVKLLLEPPAQPPAPPVKSMPSNLPQSPTIPQLSPRQRLRQRMVDQNPLPPPPPMLNRAPGMALPPPPPPVEKVEAPIVTLDDLFRKTKATPRIYYLPLSEEQVAAKCKSSEHFLGQHICLLRETTTAKGPLTGG